MSFDTLEFHERAVRTPSHEDVGEMRDLLVETLDAAGASPEVDDAGNVVATRNPDGHDAPGVARDAAESPHLVLNTHIDTVPPHVPFERRESPPAADESIDGSRDSGGDTGDVVCGRGACDAKGPLAALVAAFLGTDPKEGRLTLAITPDEETVQTGAAALAGSLDADGYIVGEPTGLDVCTAARGQFEGSVTIRGASAHAATPESGANAIRAAAPVLQAMETYGQERGPDEHDDLGRPTLTPTLIEGGEVVNQVPAECRITFDRRSVPPETAPEFRAGLEAHLSQWTPTGMDLRVSLVDKETPFLEAFATDTDDPLVTAMADASGGDVRPFGAATEASFFAEHAPTVVFGPGDLADDAGAVAHSEREYVRRSEVERAAEAVGDALAALLS